MRRLILAASVAVAILWSQAEQLSAFDWSNVYRRVQPSVAQLFHDRGSCTAFSIHQQERYWLTANHCINEDGSMAFFKEGIPGIVTQGTFEVTKVIARSVELDLALLQSDVGFPALQPGSEPKRGNELASIGYALSEPEPFIFGSIVASVKDARSYGSTRRIILRDNQDMGGMSGGPVVDVRGRVVAMVQQGLTVGGRITNVAYGTSIRDIRKFTGIYWRSE